jgi:hypothetical protein
VAGYELFAALEGVQILPGPASRYAVNLWPSTRNSYNQELNRDFGDGERTRELKGVSIGRGQVKAISKNRNRLDNHSPYEEDVVQDFRFAATEIRSEDPMAVDRMSSISRYNEQPQGLQELEISPSKRKFGQVVYGGDTLRRKAMGYTISNARRHWLHPVPTTCIPWWLLSLSGASQCQSCIQLQLPTLRNAVWPCR